MDTQFSKANIYNDVKMVDFPRHEFEQSFTNSLTMDHGFAVPTLVDYVKPGDLIDVHSYGRAQLTPLATSSMQNIRFYTRYFYVPFRLLWSRWDEFISQDGFVETPILAPYTVITGAQATNYARDTSNLLDYVNINLLNLDSSNKQINYSPDARISFNIFSILAYSLIWDTYFRDENLQTPLFNIDDVSSGYNAPGDLRLTLLPIAKEKDYFTTSLPWTQKGQPVSLGTSIELPSNPIYFKHPTNGFQLDDLHLYLQAVRGVEAGDNGLYYLNGNNRPVTNAQGISSNDPEYYYNRPYVSGIGSTASLTDLQVEGGLYTKPIENISSSFNINELRYANALQRYLERLALGGNRPAEFYLSMYGVQVDDLRIGQPKYLGGGSSYIHVTSIPQTSESSNTPQGTLAGNGQVSLDTRFNDPYYCQEFGVLMAISYIRPELNYTQGLPRMYQLFEHLDFYNPIFAHLGEEEVRKSELMIKPDFYNNPSEPEFNNDDTFGYQSRYAYLKGKRNEIHGELKTTLRDWMLTERYSEPPTLNSTFVTQPQNYDIFAVTEATHHYIVEIRHDYQMVSNMPDFAIPSL